MGLAALWQVCGRLYFGWWGRLHFGRWDRLHFGRGEGVTTLWLGWLASLWQVWKAVLWQVGGLLPGRWVGWCFLRGLHFGRADGLTLGCEAGLEAFTLLIWVLALNDRLPRLLFCRLGNLPFGRWGRLNFGRWARLNFGRGYRLHFGRLGRLHFGRWGRLRFVRWGRLPLCRVCRLHFGKWVCYALLGGVCCILAGSFMKYFTAVAPNVAFFLSRPFIISYLHLVLSRMTLRAALTSCSSRVCSVLQGLTGVGDLLLYGGSCGFICCLIFSHFPGCSASSANPFWFLVAIFSILEWFSPSWMLGGWVVGYVSCLVLAWWWWMPLGRLVAAWWRWFPCYLVAVWRWWLHSTWWCAFPWCLVFPFRWAAPWFWWWADWWWVPYWWVLPFGYWWSAPRWLFWCWCCLYSWWLVAGGCCYKAPGWFVPVCCRWLLSLILLLWGGVPVIVSAFCGDCLRLLFGSV